MTLEEAIEHAEDIAISAIGCECREEHRQLAEWLRELQERREQPEIVRCGECEHKGTHNCIANILATIYGYEVKDDFYCGLAERRTDGENLSE
jgi:hypothetical protein